MTLVSSIINDALRETNIIPLGKAPTDAENVEGLRRLQALVLSVLGNEAGENLLPMALGNNEIKSPSGYPWYNNELPGNVFVSSNTRLMLNLTGLGSVNLPPVPNDGARFGIVDVSHNLATYPLEIIGNGRSIEGEDVLTLSTAGLSREWFYRGDLGNWVRVTDITLLSQLPFPPEFDDMFIIMLASRLNPRYGQTLAPESQAMMQRARTQFRARYRQEQQATVDAGLLYLSGDLRFGGRFKYTNLGSENIFFNKGFPYA